MTSQYSTQDTTYMLNTSIPTLNLSSELSYQSISSQPLSSSRIPENYIFQKEQAKPEETGCLHDKVTVFEGFQSCCKCGLYMPEGVKSYKSSKLDFQTYFPVNKIYQALTKRAWTINRSSNPEYAKVRVFHVEMILDIAGKIKFSNITAHLGIFILDAVMFGKPELTKNYKICAAVSLLLAAKTIELDCNVPFIPKYKVLFDNTTTIAEYKDMEIAILEYLDWNPQFTSFFELVEFLLAQGIVYSNDGIGDSMASLNKKPDALRDSNQNSNSKNKSAEKKLLNPTSPNSKENFYNENIIDSSFSVTEPKVSSLSSILRNLKTSPTKPKQAQLLKQQSMPSYLEKKVIDNEDLTENPLSPQKVKEIITYLEKNYRILCTLIVKDLDFIEFSPKILACATIAFLRYSNNITPLWNFHLVNFTQVGVNQLLDCFQLIKNKFEVAFVLNTPTKYLSPCNEIFANEKINSSRSNLKLPIVTHPDQKIIDILSLHRSNTTPSNILTTMDSNTIRDPVVRRIIFGEKEPLSSRINHSFALDNDQLNHSFSNHNIPSLTERSGSLSQLSNNSIRFNMPSEKQNDILARLGIQ